MRWIVTFCIGCVFVGVLVWSHVLRSHHLSAVPPGLEVTRVLYAAEEAWGYGPGGNETGIIVYQMPPSAKVRIERGGKEWLETLPGSGKRWRGRYSTWHQTPFDPNVNRAFDIWNSGEYCGHGGGIAGYMFRYGFCIPFDKDVERLANDALSSSGSYYAFGRIGMLLLNPEKSRIIYAYNG